MRSTVIAVLVLTVGAPLGATTLVATDLAEMSREAHAIALGRVIALEPRWTADRRRIDTLVTLETESYLKGALGSNVQFLVPGGRLGRFRNLIVGAPQLDVGQRVVVFLGARGPSIPFIIGFNQGLFRVVPQNGGWMVTPPAVLALPRPRRDAQRRPIRLDDFAREVRALASRRP